VNAPHALATASDATAATTVVDDLLAGVAAHGVPRFAIVSFSVAVDVAGVMGLLRDRLPDVVLIGTTSYLGGRFERR
jgi:hypothetical protein